VSEDAERLQRQIRAARTMGYSHEQVMEMTLVELAAVCREYLDIVALDPEWREIFDMIDGKPAE